MRRVLTRAVNPDGTAATRESTNTGKLVIFGLTFKTLLEYQIQVATLIAKRTIYKDHRMLMAKMTALPSAGNSRRIQGLLMTMDDAHMTSAIWTALENHHMMGTLRLLSLIHI